MRGVKKYRWIDRHRQTDWQTDVQTSLILSARTYLHAAYIVCPINKGIIQVHAWLQGLKQIYNKIKFTRFLDRQYSDSDR